MKVRFADASFQRLLAADDFNYRIGAERPDSDIRSTELDAAKRSLEKLRNANFASTTACAFQRSRTVISA